MQKILYVLVPMLLLSGCRGGNSSTSASLTATKEPTSQTSITSQPTTSATSTTTSAHTSTSSTHATSATHSGSSVPKPTSDSYSEGRNILPIGYLQPDAPTNSPVNIETSLSAAKKYEYSLIEDLPSNWVYTYKNAASNGPSGHHTSPGFYSYNSSKKDEYPGGLKITNPYVGFQSMRFTHCGEKLELHIGITQVNNASDSPEKSKNIGYLYFFNGAGELINGLTKTIEKGVIEAKTKDLKFYITGSGIKDVQYFEYWAEAKPFKSSQCYNYGIGVVSIQSWERE